MATNKGWYRYKLDFAASRGSFMYDANIFLHKRDKDGKQQDFSREEAEVILRHIGLYMEQKADFKNLTEDF